MTELYLFGSRARGDNRYTSDIDVLCVDIDPDDFCWLTEFMANSNVYKGGMIDMYTYGKRFFSSMSFQRLPIWKPEYLLEISRQCRPITIQEILEICREVQPVLNAELSNLKEGDIKAKDNGRKFRYLGPNCWEEVA